MWSDPTVQQVAFSALTLIVGLVTLAVVIRQQRTMTKQLEVMKKQDELLARRPSLSLRLDSKYLDQHPRIRMIYFLVGNNGNRSASNFYWHIFLPSTIADDNPIRTDSGKQFLHEEDAQFINNIPYRIYRGFYKEPVYPSRELSCLHFRAQGANINEPMDIYWKLICEDGQFPDQQGMAKIHLPP